MSGTYATCAEEWKLVHVLVTNQGVVYCFPKWKFNIDVPGESPVWLF